MLYAQSLASTRSGAAYNAFSYPTKISAESVALFLACQTHPGDVVLDAFGGSGTTGIAALLCDKPTEWMKASAARLSLNPIWGPRRAIIQDLSVIGSLVAEVLCNPIDPARFESTCNEILKAATSEIGWMYECKDADGASGTLRHGVWSELLVCSACGAVIPYWDAAARVPPARFLQDFACAKCGCDAPINSCARLEATFDDHLLGTAVTQRSRVLSHVYGETDGRTWRRPASSHDIELASRIASEPAPRNAPVARVLLRDLYRAGYHTGITHLHHFYTPRNFRAICKLMELADLAPVDLRNAIKAWVLSYNASHATLMSRIVAKTGLPDFVVTGAQSGVLYVSALPVEKNPLRGLRRKAADFVDAFSAVRGSRSVVKVYCGDSAKLDVPSASVDYAFIDPPFGDYIPYSEINQINELWLPAQTRSELEAVISQSQGKDVDVYAGALTAVLSEINRVLRPGAKMTLVFHSAKAAVWNALRRAIKRSGFRVIATSLLDKTQSSFKQSQSKFSVQGDPLLLLEKGGVEADGESTGQVQKLLDQLPMKGNGPLSQRWLYSKYVAACMEENIDAKLSAKQFNELLERQA